MVNVSSSNNQGVRVPKLRFRAEDGCNYPQYQAETVETLFKHISRRNTTMENNNVITNSAEFGLIPQREFFDKDIAVEGNTDKYYIIEQGDFVYNPRKSTSAPYGPFNCYQFPEEGIVSPLYTCLKPLYNEYTNYLLWYFRSPSWYSYIYHNGAQGGARHDRVGMTNDLMDGIPVNLPCLDEQKKISRFLTTLEKQIEKQRQLVEALKSYKRGALSKLFPQKGEAVPKYRFAGFTEPWEQHKFAELYEKVSRKNDMSYGKNDIISVANMYYKPDSYITDESYLRTYNVFELGDIAFEGNKSKNFAHGRFVENTIGNGIVSHVFDVFRPIMQPYDLLFWKYLINNERIMGSILIRCTKASTMMTNLVANDFLNESILIPSYNEQKVIGQFLSRLDDIIIFHQRKLSVLQNAKSGLLQQMFI